MTVVNGRNQEEGSEYAALPYESSPTSPFPSEAPASSTAVEDVVVAEAEAEEKDKDEMEGFDHADDENAQGAEGQEVPVSPFKVTFVDGQAIVELLAADGSYSVSSSSPSSSSCTSRA